MSNNSPIVIDSNSDYTRAGLSSGDEPTAIFPTNSVTSTPPMGADGIVTNWDSMKAVLSHTFKELGVDPSQYPILITEPPGNLKTNREKMTQIFFDTFNVPKLHMTMGEILALYDAGKTTGVAVNLALNGRFVGIVPSYQGYPFYGAITNHSFDTNTLGDREFVKICELIYRSISVCDFDVRSTLYRNIILTGGSSQFSGLATKIQAGVTSLAPPTETVSVFEPTEPENGAWRGGDKVVPILNDCGSWITKQEYQQYGATIVQHKCPS